MKIPGRPAATSSDRGAPLPSASGEILDVLLAGIGTAVMIVDEQLLVEVASASFRDGILGGADPAGTRLPVLLDRVAGTWAADVMGAALRCLASSSAVSCSTRTGWSEHAIWFDVSATPLASGGALLQAHDVTAAVSTARVFGRDRSYDFTTALRSRTGILDWIERELVDQPARQLCVAMLQIDQFDIVNGTLGARQGDELLLQVADHIREQLPPGAAAAHTDRATFCVVFPSIGANEVDYRSAELRDAVRQPVQARGRTMRLTASVGTSLVVDHWAAVRAVREAEVAMLEARRRGGNRYAPYVPEGIEVREGVLRKWDALSDALQFRQLEVWFQPIVSLATGRAIAAEALCRWHHPQFGEVSPMEFIPLAEWGAEIGRLGAFVQDSAAQAVAAVRSGAGAHAREFQASINVSSHELAVPHFGTSFLARLMANGTRADLMAIEVDEEALSSDDPVIARNLRALAGAGVCVTIGDFGAGHSSVERLLAIPVTRVKLARRFVAGMLTDPLAARVVGSTIALGRELGIQVVAEGVESAAQAKELTSLGCSAAQGYLYAPAVKGGELTGVIRDFAEITNR